jgi:hypothetical protein
MRKINTDHTYEYNDVTGYVTNCFGDDMRGTDDHIDELNLLMGEIRALTEQRDRLAEVLKELADSCITIDGQERGALKAAREALQSLTTNERIEP